MAKEAKPSRKQHQPRGPVYWFALLDMARERRDVEAATEAAQELRARGVIVQYTKPQQVLQCA